MVEVSGIKRSFFTLRSDLGSIDSLGMDYEYEMKPHGNGDEIEVWYLNQGEWVYDLYTRKEVNKKFEEGIWLGVKMND